MRHGLEAHATLIGAEAHKVDRALRRAMLNICGFAASLASSAERSIHLTSKFRKMAILFTAIFSKSFATTKCVR
jgi:hypothetical protein